MLHPDFSVQKLHYIHNNLVEAGVVEKAEDYLYSSARSYQQKKDGLAEVEFCKNKITNIAYPAKQMTMLFTSRQNGLKYFLSQRVGVVIVTGRQ